ncbi:MAG: nitrous oxide-stimulated promoter family protein, partial [Candidatus Thiodiazotropha endolucinida]|nr:nitrous oxide-stimulated promoter family protein [Candidatus Thiodiazotropha taylori]MCW4240950.1 nitrous oxide-stimulated promoter family protein [Candidatus Thiodiazotropha taylori]
QDVMRYAGPRMLLRHPLLSLYHLLDKFRKVPQLPKGKK